MTTTNLTFTKVNNEWVSTFTSQGACVIELERDVQSPVSVSANLEGMKPVVVASFSNPYVDSVIFSLDIMEGIVVTIKSANDVINAKMQTND